MFPNKELLQLGKQSGIPGDSVFQNIFHKAPASVKTDFIKEIKQVFST